MKAYRELVGNWRDMGNIYVNACSDTAVSQNWFVMGDGRIALEPSNRSKCSIYHPCSGLLEPSRGYHKDDSHQEQGNASTFNI